MKFNANFFTKEYLAKRNVIIHENYSHSNSHIPQDTRWSAGAILLGLS